MSLLKLSFDRAESIWNWVKTFVADNTLGLDTSLVGNCSEYDCYELSYL